MPRFPLNMLHQLHWYAAVERMEMKMNYIVLCCDISVFQPAISVGNVGQLACDLLISSLKLQKIGYFDPELFLPIVGNNPFATSEKDKNILSLSCEGEESVCSKCCGMLMQFSFLTLVACNWATMIISYLETI